MPGRGALRPMPRRAIPTKKPISAAARGNKRTAEGGPPMPAGDATALRRGFPAIASGTPPRAGLSRVAPIGGAGDHSNEEFGPKPELQGESIADVSPVGGGGHRAATEPRRLGDAAAPLLTRGQLRVKKGRAVPRPCLDSSEASRCSGAALAAARGDQAKCASPCADGRHPRTRLSPWPGPRSDLSA